MRSSGLVLLMALMLAGACGGDGEHKPDFKFAYPEARTSEVEVRAADAVSTEVTTPVEDLSQGELAPDVDIMGPPDSSLDAFGPDIPDAKAVELTDAMYPEDIGGEGLQPYDGSVEVTWPDVVLDATADAEIAEEDVWVEPPPLFDLLAIRDPVTAKCTFHDEKIVIKDMVPIETMKVNYYSWESIDGELVPIMIKGFAARPVGGGDNLPGIVVAHGLGGFAKESNAVDTAALLGMFTLAYTGPGGGDQPDNTSEGLSADHADGYRLFDTIPDLRGSWFWGHAVAGLRGVTCLEFHPDVDPSKLGFTGFSAGGVATLMAASVDNRIKAAVPLSGTLAWGVSVQSPEAWQHDLLTAASLTVESPEWLKLLQLVDPTQTLAQAEGKIMMVNGSCDEFFPLTAHMACYGAIPGDDKRTSISANFDHGCYLLTGVEDPDTIKERAELRASGAQRMWFQHWLGTESDYDYVPAPPAVDVVPVGLTSFVTATVDTGGPKLQVEDVRIWWSNDDAFLFVNAALDDQGNGIYSQLTLFPTQANSVYFVDVQYKTNELLFPQRFSISSSPVMPEGFVPHIRNVDTCL